MNITTSMTRFSQMYNSKVDIYKVKMMMMIKMMIMMMMMIMIY